MKREKKKNPNVGKFWRAVGIAFAFFMVFLTLQLWISIIVSIVDMVMLLSRNGIAILEDTNRLMEAFMGVTLDHLPLVVLISNILTVAAFWVFYLIRKKSFRQEVGLHKLNWQTILLSLAYGFGMCFVVDLITQFLPVSEAMMQEFALQHAMLFNGNPLVTFLSIAVAAPIAEEVTFRGLCYTNLKKGMRTIWAALISAIFFGIAHGNPIWFLVGFLAGLSLVWIYERTGSLFASILVHMTNNALAYVTQLLPMNEVLNYVLCGVGLVVFPLSVFFIMKYNPKRQEKRPQIDLLEDGVETAAVQVQESLAAEEPAVDPTEAEETAEVSTETEEPVEEQAAEEN